MAKFALTPLAVQIGKHAEACLARGDAAGAESYLVEQSAAHAAEPAVAAIAGRLLLWRLQNHDRAFPLIERALTAFADDPELLSAHAYAAWIVDQRDPNAARALQSIQRLADQRPEDGGVHRLMGMIALSRFNYELAQHAFTKALALGVNCRSYLALAETMLSGRREADVNVDGETYRFGLTTQSTQAIEAGSYHCAGALTELGELRFVRDKVAPGGVIVEVGVLVGNHTAYFLRNLRPRKAILFEADPLMVPVVRANADRNNAGSEIVVHNAFVGGTAGGSTRFAGQDVPAVRLSDTVTDKVDFLKIDVDGAETSVLSGAAALIEQHRPFVMIEVTPVTKEPVTAWFGSRGYGLAGEIGHGSYINLFWRG